MPGIPWNTIMTGETQIAERDGTILARMTYEDGEGSIAADVRIAEPAPVDPIPSGFWVRPQCFSIHFVWHYMKNHGRLRYPIDKALGRFPWQEWPDYDIPNHNPGTVDVSDAKQGVAETNGKQSTPAETKAGVEAEA